VIEIDGSQGEGGGQVLRTALSLSALTGQPARLFNLRARRPKPGLAPQHLAAIRAVAAVCSAELRGDALRSTQLEFRPQHAPRPGRYAIDVTEAAGAGSAGAVTLIAQALLLPLALAGGESTLVLRGGTHVPMSPAWHYLAEVFLPTLAAMGVPAEGRLDAWGFYPAGGGQVTMRVGAASAGLRPLALDRRGPLSRVRGVGVAANLPAHIPQRIAARAANVLGAAGLKADVRPERVRASGPGAGLFLLAEYEGSRAGFSALGSKGKPSEQVAEEASYDLLAYHRSGLPVDMHLADQLLLPAAVAAGRSELMACRLTEHALTNAHVIRQFLDIAIEIEGEVDGPGRGSVDGAGLTAR
jgi:RNA 3'-terminal phosphate cyclase (ATP)